MTKKFINFNLTAYLPEYAVKLKEHPALTASFPRKSIFGAITSMHHISVNYSELEEMTNYL